MLQSDVLSKKNGVLKDGILSIIAMMSLPEVPGQPQMNHFIRENMFAKKMSSLHLNIQHADVMFVIHGRDDDDVSNDAGENEEGSQDADEFNDDDFVYAHRFILQTCAPGLAMICEPYDDLTPVLIYGVDRSIFTLALKYVYGLSIPYSAWENHSQDLINAADLYKLTGLKLEAKVWLVKFKKITVENVLDLLIYAKFKNCHLLKEAVMKFLVYRSTVLHNFPSRKLWLLICLPQFNLLRHPEHLAFQNIG